MKNTRLALAITAGYLTSAIILFAFEQLAGSRTCGLVGFYLSWPSGLLGYLVYGKNISPLTVWMMGLGVFLLQGALVWCVSFLALRCLAVFRKQEPIQPPQRNAGSRPSSDASSASETPSSLGPRG